MEAVWIILGVVTAICIFGIAVLWVRRSFQRVSVPDAKHMFDLQAQQLKSLFFTAASSTGLPRGLTWKSCEFGTEPEFARDKRSGEMLALLPLTIAFEAIPGSDMEGLPAVGNLRAATAVFSLRGREWTTAGRAVFNMNPAEAIRHFREQYEPVSTNGTCGTSAENQGS
jgi:hypothetical protein